MPSDHEPENEYVVVVSTGENKNNIEDSAIPEIAELNEESTTPESDAPSKGTTADHGSYGAEIDQIISVGSKFYGLKNFDDAATQFGHACELYSEANGYDDPILLLMYGRALFQAGVSKSEVLGDRSATAEPEAESTPSSHISFAPDFEPEQEEEGDENEQVQEETEQTDLEVAWEMLDLARTLFTEKITKLKESIGKGKGKGKDDGSFPELTSLEKSLADTFDLLGEVSLESENFSEAVQDLSSSLKIKQKIYSEESPLVCEAHFKLSLALEFDFEKEDGKQQAIKEMEAAVSGVKSRVKLGPLKDPELLKDLETRVSVGYALVGQFEFVLIQLHDLKESLNEKLSAVKSDAIQGLVGEEVKGQIAQTLAAANDISGLVRKRKKEPSKSDEGSKSESVEPKEPTKGEKTSISESAEPEEPSDKRSKTES